MKENKSLSGNMQDLAFVGPMFPISFIHAPVLTILQPIYAKYFGVSLAAIAGVLLLGRLFDAITDPIIGYYADRFRSKYRSPAPIIYAGAIFMAISAWFLLIPVGYAPSQGRDTVSVGYFGFWFLAYYLAHTAFDMPHMAWAGSIAETSTRKTRIYTYRSFLGLIGVFLFYAVPFLPWHIGREITPQTLKMSVLIFFILAPAFFVAFYFVVRQMKVDSSTSQTPQQERVSLIEVYRILAKNKPFRVLVCAQACTGLGSSAYFALLFFFIDGYLGLGQFFPTAIAVGYGVGVVSLKLWYEIAARLDKHTSLLYAMLLVSIGLVGTAFLSPGENSWAPLLICVILVKCGFAAFLVMTSSILSDISDYGTWKYGPDNASSYFAIFTLLNKGLSAFGAAAALAFIGWLHFDPASKVQSDAAIAGLKIAFIWAPAALILLSTLFISKLPIDRRRHEIIRQRLMSRAERALAK